MKYKLGSASLPFLIIMMVLFFAGGSVGVLIYQRNKSYKVTPNITPLIPQDNTQLKKSTTSESEVYPSYKESAHEEIFSGELPFKLMENVDAKIVGVRKYFSDERGLWKINLYYGGTAAQGNPTSGGGLSSNLAMTVVDLKLTNTSQTSLQEVHYPDLFRMESGSEAYYSGYTIAETRGGHYSLKVLPKQSVFISLYFALPKTLETADFWYGKTLTDLIDGFTIDYVEKTAYPFKG